MSDELRIFFSLQPIPWSLEKCYERCVSTARGRSTIDRACYSTIINDTFATCCTFICATRDDARTYGKEKRKFRTNEIIRGASRRKNSSFALRARVTSSRGNDLHPLACSNVCAINQIRYFHTFMVMMKNTTATISASIEKDNVQKSKKVLASSQLSVMKSINNDIINSKSFIAENDGSESDIEKEREDFEGDDPESSSSDEDQSEKTRIAELQRQIDEISKNSAKKRKRLGASKRVTKVCAYFSQKGRSQERIFSSTNHAEPLLAARVTQTRRAEIGKWKLCQGSLPRCGTRKTVLEHVARDLARNRVDERASSVDQPNSKIYKHVLLVAQFVADKRFRIIFTPRLLIEFEFVTVIYQYILFDVRVKRTPRESSWIITDTFISLFFSLQLRASVDRWCSAWPELEAEGGRRYRIQYTCKVQESSSLLRERKIASVATGGGGGNMVEASRESWRAAACI
ncbi:unnamed protein product [Trichogramma brassicae]|uniref:Uncharacterized protein n=1 Tax=Trichogramma brassicae TaxID=86971 RepID=A0A6H5IQ56_9HYME|nr:unnamed protein product [Trichogramma brassicae]